MQRRAVLVLALFVQALSAQGQATQWWKGNLHTHTLWSDGNDFPEMVVAWYYNRDYHFLALSDHNVLQRSERWVDNDLVVRLGGRKALVRYRDFMGTDWVETREHEGTLQVRLKRFDEYRPQFERSGEFLLLEAEEITAAFDKLPVHLVATNLEHLIEPQTGSSVSDVIARNLRAVRAQEKEIGRPILAHVNHPNYGYAITAEDLAEVVEEQFFEVFNGHPGVNHLGDSVHPGTERLWDIANALRLAKFGLPPLYGIATDDSHHYHNGAGAAPGRGWVMVRAADLTPTALIEAMRRGDFYGSSGVTLGEIAFEHGELRLTIAAQGGARFTTQFVGTRRDADLDGRDAVPDDESRPVSKRYSDAIGAVFATVEGLEPRYRLEGDELYVRAVVTSSEPARSPAYSGAMQQAWTQPVGWTVLPAAPSPGPKLK